MMTKDRQIGSGVSVTHPAVILTKGNVEDPMELILNAPMVTESLGKALGIIGQAGDEVAGLIY